LSIITACSKTQEVGWKIKTWPIEPFFKVQTLAQLRARKKPQPPIAALDNRFAANRVNTMPSVSRLTNVSPKLHVVPVLMVRCDTTLVATVLSSLVV
jgi:hypothetical protein